MDVLNGNDHDNEFKEKKWRITRYKEIFKVVQSEYFSYVYCYFIFSNYEKGITHSVSIWQSFGKIQSLLVTGGLCPIYRPI